MTRRLPLLASLGSRHLSIPHKIAHPRLVDVGGFDPIAEEPHPPHATNGRDPAAFACAISAEASVVLAFMRCSLSRCRRPPAHLLPQDTAPPRSVASCRRPAKGPSMPVRWRRAPSLSRRSMAASRFGSRRTERKCSSAGGRRGRHLRPAIFDPALAKVTELRDLRPSDSVCAVCWTRKGSYLAIATSLEMSSCKEVL